LGNKRYTPDIIERTDPRGRKYYWIGTGTPAYADREGTDVWAVQNGYISLSVIKYDLNSPEDHSLLAEAFKYFKF
jgi:5'-nucleotidase